MTLAGLGMLLDEPLQQHLVGVEVAAMTSTLGLLIELGRIRASRRPAVRIASGEQQECGQRDGRDFEEVKCSHVFHGITGRLSGEKLVAAVLRSTQAPMAFNACGARKTRSSDDGQVDRIYVQ